jgi:cell division GTPase FtsZ
MKIKLIGVGTSASVMVGKLLKQKIKDIDYTIISTSSRDKVIVKEFLYDEKYKERKFEEIDNDWKNQTNFSYFMLGEKTLNGATVVKDYESLELAIQESKDELDIFLERELKDTNIVILIAGLGGMNGSYVTPVVLEKIKQMNIYTIGILWTPFKFEGIKRNERATKALKEIEDQFDKIMTINPNVLIINYKSIISAFRNSDEIIIKRISDTVNEIKNADADIHLKLI